MRKQKSSKRVRKGAEPVGQFHCLQCMFRYLQKQGQPGYHHSDSTNYHSNNCQIEPQVPKLRATVEDLRALGAQQEQRIKYLEQSLRQKDQDSKRKDQRIKQLQAQVSYLSSQQRKVELPRQAAEGQVLQQLGYMITLRLRFFGSSKAEFIEALSQSVGQLVVYEQLEEFLYNQPVLIRNQNQMAILVDYLLGGQAYRSKNQVLRLLAVLLEPHSDEPVPELRGLLQTKLRTKREQLSKLWRQRGQSDAEGVRRLLSESGFTRLEAESVLASLSIVSDSPQRLHFQALLGKLQ